MSFETIGPNAVSSSDGFSVVLHVPLGMTYEEGGRRIHVDSEVMAIKAVLLYVDSIRTWEPDGEAVTHGARERVISRLKAALAHLGLEAQINRAEPWILKRGQ